MKREAQVYTYKKKNRRLAAIPLLICIILILAILMQHIDAKQEVFLPISIFSTLLPLAKHFGVSQSTIVLTRIHARLFSKYKK